MKSLVALIQARMGSTRFPGKVLADIEGRSMLMRVVDRVRLSKRIDRLAVVTSTDLADDRIDRVCAAEEVDCYRGSAEDVLDRYYQAARHFQATTVVRITADCPLSDPEIVDRVIDFFEEKGCDYASNTLRITYPDGLDVEVFSFSALERAWKEAQSPADREHVTPYFRHSGFFQVKNVDSGLDPFAQELRLTVDEPEDIEFVRCLYRELPPKASLDQLLDLLQRKPCLLEINQKGVRNEGYYRSIAQEPPPPAVFRSLGRSLSLKEKGERLIPSCSQTFSKCPSQFVQGVAPVFLSHGEGSHVWDVDGNEYIDYSMGLGPVILGHTSKPVIAAIQRQIEQGITFSLPHPLEIELAEQLVDLIPCGEMVRFGKNGSDATAGAVRVARAYTGRDVIACCGYHGWQDWFIGTTTRNRGVPVSVRDLTVPFIYNDLDSLHRIFHEHPGRVAAVIMEPVGVVEPIPGFLQAVRDLTCQEGSLLIYDEVVTGFRLSLGGAQHYFGVTPDLACFGKAIANGMPLSAVVGRRDVMTLFDEIFFSFTFGGETLSLTAALAVLRELREKDVIPHLWSLGRKLKDGYNALAKFFGVSEWTTCVGYAPRTIIQFKMTQGVDALVLKSVFQQECLKRGILFTGAHNMCFAHSEGDVERTLRVYRAAIEIVADAVKSGDAQSRLEGLPVQSVFRQP